MPDHSVIFQGGLHGPGGSLPLANGPYWDRGSGLERRETESKHNRNFRVCSKNFLAKIAPNRQLSAKLARFRAIFLRATHPLSKTPSPSLPYSAPRRNPPSEIKFQKMPKIRKDISRQICDNSPVG